LKINSSSFGLKECFEFKDITKAVELKEVLRDKKHTKNLNKAKYNYVQALYLSADNAITTIETWCIHMH